MGRAGREPDIERGIRLARGEEREALGQAQRGAVEARTGGVFGLGAEAAAQPQPVARDLVAHRLDLDRRVAAQCAEEHCQPPAHLREVDAGSLVDALGIQTAGEGVPQFPDAFFGFPWLEVDLARHRPHPNTAVTRSRSPALTSGSSVSGSIMAVSMARSTRMPPAISVAA